MCARKTTDAGPGTGEPWPYDGPKAYYSKTVFMWQRSAIEWADRLKDARKRRSARDVTLAIAAFVKEDTWAWQGESGNRYAEFSQGQIAEMIGRTPDTVAQTLNAMSEPGGPLRLLRKGTARGRGSCYALNNPPYCEPTADSIKTLAIRPSVEQTRPNPTPPISPRDNGVVEHGATPPLSPRDSGVVGRGTTTPISGATTRISGATTRISGATTPISPRDNGDTFTLTITDEPDSFGAVAGPPAQPTATAPKCCTVNFPVSGGSVEKSVGVAARQGARAADEAESTTLPTFEEWSIVADAIEADPDAYDELTPYEKTIYSRGHKAYSMRRINRGPSRPQPSKLSAALSEVVQAFDASQRPADPQND